VRSLLSSNVSCCIFFCGQGLVTSLTFFFNKQHLLSYKKKDVLLVKTWRRSGQPEPTTPHVDPHHDLTGSDGLVKVILTEIRVLGGVWFKELKFNKYCSAFVLFDKKFPILD
jgi:hypothetical protein